MISKIDLHQRLKAVFPYFALVAMVASPAYALLFFALVLIARQKSQWVKPLKTIGVFGLIVDVAVFCTRIEKALVNAVPDGLMEWIFGISSFRLFYPILIALLLLWLGNVSADQLLVQQERKKREKQLTYTSEIPFDARGHEFIAGTTGAGKTTLLLQYVRDSIIAGEQLYILSGKNGTDDPRSLLNVTKALADKYNRELVVVSLNRRENARKCYNPLSEMSPTELSDALVTISDYTEPHYQACTAMWIKAICECLNLAGIPLSLNSVCDFYSFDDFRELVSRLSAANKLTKTQTKGYLALKGIAEEASLSRSRYLNLLFGDGADLFGDGEDFTNASIAKRKNAIFFVDLDSFRYTDYTRAVGRLFISDIRHIISAETDMGAKKRVIMDELGSFATEQIMPLFSQARSYGYQIIVATQSIADLDAVSETFSDRVLENCGQYAVLQLNSAQDAEKMSNIIGTYDSIETTRKVSGQLLDPSGAGTKKPVHEYKVSPDYIKELPPLNAVYYNKANPSTVCVIRVPFVEV